MSSRGDDLQARIETTVGEWLADNGGGFLTGFHILVQFVDEDGDRGWCAVTDEASACDPAAALGRLRFHTLATEVDVKAYLAGNLGYDDADDE